MKSYLQEVIKNNQYYPVNEKSSIFTNTLKSEYFLIENYSEEDFMNYFESDTTERLIEEFNESQYSLGFENLKKNTLLFILVEVENMKTAYEELRNQLILIEEDIYYFRKFVILFTKDALSQLESIQSTNQLYNLLKKKMPEFEKDMFFEDSYFLAMEMAIKLPFFKINALNEDYQTIEEKYTDREDQIDEQLLNLFDDSEDYVSFLSDIEMGAELLTKLSNILDEEL